jgi:SNF2 family DNA or RNA helicase
MLFLLQRFVVVCPSSLVVNWEKEFDKWLGKATNPKRVVVKKGGEAGLSRLRAFCSVKSGQAEVLIISYDLFRMNSLLFQTVKNIGMLVVDEGHRLKNTSGSQTLTALESIPCNARLCITATPIQNNLSDFFNIANFVCPGLLGDLPTFRKGV